MAHKLVTDELAMKAADVFFDKHSPSAHAQFPWMKDMFRAALEAVADDLIEACVRAAIEAGAYEDSRGIHAIRSLKSGQ
jgi:hypothetical protein